MAMDVPPGESLGSRGRFARTRRFAPAAIFVLLIAASPAGAAKVSPRAGGHSRQTTSASPQRGAGRTASKSPGLRGSSSLWTPCAFYQADSCASYDPHVTLFTWNDGNTSSCRFYDDVTWDDGTGSQRFITGGLTHDGFQTVAAHTYEPQLVAAPVTRAAASPLGVYTIHDSAGVVSGGCTYGGSGTHTFTLLPRPTADSPSDKFLEEQQAIAHTSDAAECVKWFGQTPPQPPGPFDEEDTHATMRKICNWWFGASAADGAHAMTPQGPPPESVSRSSGAADYKTVFEPRAFPVPKVDRDCAHLAGAACRRFRSALVDYAKNLSRVASFSEAAGVAAVRFDQAKSAGDLTSRNRQGLAAANYVRLEAKAIKKLRASGQDFAAQLERDGLDDTMTAQQVTNARDSLGQLDGVPDSVVDRLKNVGLIESRKNLKAAVEARLAKAPSASSTSLSELFAP